MEKLSKEDITVINYLARYKIMLVEDTRYIYHSKWYYRKKIKRLIEDGYIKKYKFYYIELDKKGRKMIGLTGKDYIKNKSNESYMERLKQISKIGTITINSNIRFIPSWNMKEKDIYTDTARKYLGKMITNQNTYLIYAISDKKDKKYIHQLFYDINKILDHKQIIIFVDSIEKLEDEYQYMSFKKEHTYIIINSKENRDVISKYKYIDFYELVKKIMGEEKQILFSDWELADYVFEKNLYILNMLFLDVEKINEIRWFYHENKNTKKTIKILTLKENEETIKKLIPENSEVVGINKSYLLKGG